MQKVMNDIWAARKRASEDGSPAHNRINVQEWMNNQFPDDAH